MKPVMLTEQELITALTLLKMGHQLTGDSSFFTSSEALKADGSLTDNSRPIISRSLSFYSLISQGLTDILSEKFSINIPEGFSLSDYSVDEEAFASLKKKLKEKNKTPSRKLYIADCHFFHNNLNYLMDKRGFSDYQEMGEHMISQWNSSVTDRDEVFIIGDFSISGGISTNEILRQLKGHKHLIIGNHDRFLEDKEFDSSLLDSIRPYAEINDNGRKVILSHYPIICYNGQYHRDKQTGEPKTYMLYGHVHNTHDELLVNKFISITHQTVFTYPDSEETFTVPNQMINCFCMFSDYIPVTLDEWIEIDKKRRETTPLL